MRTPTHEEKLSDISRVVHLLSKQCISLVDYRDAGGKYSRWHMFLGGDTWTGLCGELGISTKTAGRVTDDEYFERLAKFVRREKRLPKVSERAVARLQFRKRRWPTLSKFIEEAIRRGKISDSYSPTPSEPPLPPSSTSAHRPIDRASSSSSVRQVPPPPRFDLRKHPKWRRIDIAGMPYEPQDENAVIALFAILCHRNILPWQILDVNGGAGIDAICFDDTNNTELRVEFKLVLSESNWNHDINDLDVVVCWENRWRRFPKQVLELRKLISGVNRE